MKKRGIFKTTTTRTRRRGGVETEAAHADSAGDR
jgi:hypothetical protein